MSSILVTGAAGLVGKVLCARLEKAGRTVVRLDIRPAAGGLTVDIRDPESLRQALRLQELEGVIHLAAVSRVADAQKNPLLCFQTNVQAMAGLVGELLAMPRAPWLIYASSREIYGHPAALPVTEEMTPAPVNVYGHSKLAGEKICDTARHAGLRVLSLRLSNAYGAAEDHATRVIPAFARAAIRHEELCVEGKEHVFDFVHIDDVARLFELAIPHVSCAETVLQPLHCVTGVGTTLQQLARMVMAAAGGGRMRDYPERDYDVGRFVGDPAAARRLLGWEAEIPLQQGLERFIPAMRRYLEEASDTSLRHGA